MQLRRWSERLKILGADTLPLRLILVAPFIAQVALIVGLVGYLSYRAGEQAVSSLVNRLITETSDRVNLYVESSVKEARRLNTLIVDAIERGDINLDLTRNNPQRDRLLWQHIQLAESVGWISLGTPNGDYHGVTRQIKRPSPTSFQIVASNAATNRQRIFYATNERGERAEFVAMDQRSYDVRSRPWYQSAMNAGVLAWSEIYSGYSEDSVYISASAPVYESTSETDVARNTAPSSAARIDQPPAETTISATQPLQGVVAVDLSLELIDSYLRQASIGRSGTIVMMDRQGGIIASSTEESPIFVNNQNQLTQATIFNADFPLIQAAANALFPRASADDSPQALTEVSRQPVSFVFEQERYFVKGLPLRNVKGLDWTIVAVVPASEFMGYIRANTLRTVILCVVALAGAIAIGDVTARWIVSPIVKLNRAAKDLAQGNFDSIALAEATEKRPDEVGQLALSFHQMSDQLKQAFNTMKADQQRLSDFLEAIPVGIAIHRPDGSIFYLNQAGRTLLAMDVEVAADAEVDSLSPQADSLAGRYRLCHAETHQPYPDASLPTVQALQGNEAIADDLAVQREERVIPLEAKATPVFTVEGQVEYAITVFQDISERKHSERILKHYSQDLEQQVAERTRKLEREIQERQKVEQQLKRVNSDLEYLAKVDSLTQIANRRRFNERLMEEWQRQTRAQQPLSLLLIDVDEFKRYNDCHGHQQGDRCLVVLARALNQSVKRPADVVARYGGEEFAIILPETNLQGAIVVAERIRLMIQRANIPHETSSVSSNVTVSIGIASTVPALGMMQNTLITEADRMLYRAKTLGRDRYETTEFGYSPSASESSH